MPDARYVYIGNGTDHLFGIPARDLTAADLAALDTVQRATVSASRLYQAAPEPKQADAKHSAPAPVAGVKNAKDAG